MTFRDYIDAEVDPREIGHVTYWLSEELGYKDKLDEEVEDIDSFKSDIEKAMELEKQDAEDYDNDEGQYADGGYNYFDDDDEDDDYEESDNFLRLRVKNDDGKGVVTIVNDGNHWMETWEKWEPYDEDDDGYYSKPQASSYMGYLSANDIKQWLRQDGFEILED